MSKYLLDLNKIQSGDIILIRSETRESQIIQRQSNCLYSHAMLYVGESSYIEADGLGVHALNAARKLFDDPGDALALRLTDNKLVAKIETVVEYVRRKIGTEYSTAEARQAARSPTSSAAEENRQFCSRLVAQAYSYADTPIVNNPDYATPKDLLDSTKLSPIKEILIEASEKDIAYAMEKNTVLDKQIDATNIILESARNITGGDMQTLEQLTEFMQANEKFDQQIVEIIKASGYLDSWKVDEAKNPGHYNFEILKDAYSKNILPKAGYQLSRVAMDNLERYQIMLTQYNWYVLNLPSTYNLLFKELYENLVHQGERMYQAGLKAINSKSQ